MDARTVARFHALLFCNGEARVYASITALLDVASGPYHFRLAGSGEDKYAWDSYTKIADIASDHTTTSTRSPPRCATGARCSSSSRRR